MNTKPLSSSAIPGDAERALPEDIAQALFLISTILSINDDAEIRPGDLQGMSKVLSHAEQTWSKLKAACPMC